MLRVLVMVSGGGTNLQAVIDGVASERIANTELVGVIGNKKGIYAFERARKHQIPTVCVAPGDYQNRDEFHQQLLREVRKFQPDLIVLAGFLVTIPAVMIAEYRDRIINIHPSLIPAFCGQGYYGIKVHEGVLKRGVKITGATVHFVDEGTDTGPILLQQAVAVAADDTPKSLQLRVMEEAEWQLLPAAIDLIARGKVTVTAGQAKILE